MNRFVSYNTYNSTYNTISHVSIPPFPFSCDDGHGDYNQSYDKGYEDFDYADYSTGKDDNNFRTKEKKKRKSQKQIIEDILNRWN